MATNNTVQEILNEGYTIVKVERLTISAVAQQIPSAGSDGCNLIMISADYTPASGSAPSIEKVYLGDSTVSPSLGFPLGNVQYIYDSGGAEVVPYINSDPFTLLTNSPEDFYLVTNGVGPPGIDVMILYLKNNK